MNKVYLIGRLTRDPESVAVNGSIPMCKFTLAVDRSYANTDSDVKTDFFNVNVWRNQAENCLKYLFKGSKVAVVGSLQNHAYTNKDGEKKTAVNVVASEIEFLSPKSEQSKTQVPKDNNSKKISLSPVGDEDLPF